ncbi:B-cell receptor CD22-like [Brienomyrus brachyistius]|uniref:B-cell receptor CD22-like n=1 Tax=Brienomyrus brachyistius TaxID=42636 RepID=UPI0020B36C2C|nr:B-cell receptor CD22-like [Brienomyrus brachyistius]
MTAAGRFIFIGCLLQGGLCSTWTAQMPQSIQALNGSCVLIPCTFQIPSKENLHLTNPVVIWLTKRGWSDKKKLNKSDVNINGSLSEINCTTILNGISKNWTGVYSLRIKDNNSKNKYNVTEKVEINVEDSPPSPQITINRDMVKEGGSVTLREGDSVTLTCSAPAPCPSLPPTLSWTPRLSDGITVFQENDDHTKHVSSVMNFTASHLHHKQEVKCTAVYSLQANNSERTSYTNVTLNVQYSPKNTLVLIGKDRNLTCSSDANPAVNNYTWYKVTGSETKVVSHRQNLTSNITAVSGQYYCQAQNDLGLQNSSNVQLHCELVKAPPTWVAAAAGAAGMMLVCILMQILLKTCCPRENHSSKIRVTEELTPINLTSESENETPVVHHTNTDHDRGSEWGTGSSEGISQNTLYGNINHNVQNVLIGTSVMSDAIRGMSGKRKKTQHPESRDVSGCGFRSQDSADSQKRKYEAGSEQETMEDRKSSALDDQLKTPETREEPTYDNICHQLRTNGPDDRSATVEASPEGPQDHHDVAFYPMISEEPGTNESEYAVVRKVRSLQPAESPSLKD